MVANYYNTAINGNLTYTHFECKFDAFVTLFELFVERNWEFAIAVESIAGNKWYRVYFMLYHIFSIIMFAYTTAIILHAFLLKTRLFLSTSLCRNPNQVQELLVSQSRGGDRGQKLGIWLIIEVSVLRN